MIELPESMTLERQMTKELKGKRIEKVIAGKSPHRFAFFCGDPLTYDALLRGKTVGETKAYGGHVEIELEDVRLDFSDGITFKFLKPGEPEPKKHQLYLLFDDGSALCMSVQMYGAMCAFPTGTNDNPYYIAAREKISPLSDAFDVSCFRSLIDGVDKKKTSVKAFLATQQRIPGLGNGVLQDILWVARLHPKRKLADLSGQEIAELFMAVKGILAAMAKQGGRDTEKDLYGGSGGYKTIMSKNNTQMLCPSCGGTIRKEAYLGGSVYYCPVCQKL